jgi:hypothetical protein
MKHKPSRGNCIGSFGAVTVFPEIVTDGLLYKYCKAVTVMVKLPVATLQVGVTSPMLAVPWSNWLCIDSSIC